MAAPAVADIDGDGQMEIVAARHSVLYVYRHDGTLFWKTAFGSSASNTPDHGTTRMWASPVVGDMDNDGYMEIAVGGDADSTGNINISLYDYRGQMRPGWPRQFGSTEIRSIAAADVDGDGVMEILVNKTGEGPTTAVYELDGSLHANWPQVSASCNPPSPAEACWDFGGYNQNIGAGDLDGDGVMDVISTYDAIGFGVFWGDGRPFPANSEFSDRVITAVEAYHDIALSKQGWGTGDRSEFTYSPPVVADIDDDGQMEIVLAGDHEHTNSTANQGITVWVLNIDLTRPQGWL
ncbi:MAG: VCBS repeat-containing protein [Desulfobacteraceae bacterium]|nr:VCBS repeat-containing protein [Desulfobacteraceae bacterium]